MKRLLLICCLMVSARAVESLTATGYDRRIDLHWLPAATGKERFAVERAERPDGPFVRIATAHRSNIYSDFIGENNQTFYYRIAHSDAYPSPVVSARTRELSDDELLTSIQAATFRYFWDYAHPTSGLIHERSNYGRACATGGTGFGLFALIVGAEHGFAPRAEIAERTRTILAFLEDRATRYHGAFSHWIDGTTGKTIPFSPDDDGADLIETAFLMQGALAARQYFSGTDAVETEIRTRVTRLWNAVEWDWFLKEPGGKSLYWHWSPNFEWKKNLKIIGWNEGMIAYLLAIASPTHPIPADCYYEGWAGQKYYVRNKEYYGFNLTVGRPLGGPLFFTHYSFIGFDPRNKRDRFCDYFVNNRNASLIQRAYAIENPGKHQGYGAEVWGITASLVPDGYRGNAPGTNDSGTIAPTAALSAMPYTPAESLDCLKHLYRTYGKRLWGEFGFKDAFNLDRDWFADEWLAIDQGPIIAMIENHRTGLCWRLFMANPEIEPMLKAIGWQTTQTSTSRP
ncbi:MAG: glucoamylase family protein [Planctomycetota bacterium]